MPPQKWRKNAEKLPSSNEKRPQITPELLQQLLFEIIAVCVKCWRTYKETDQAKGQKINQGVKIAALIVDAIKCHPDIAVIAKLREKLAEIEEEIAIARRIRPLHPATKGFEQAPGQ